MNNYQPHPTVGVDADFVRELGGGVGAISAAMLYNLICLFCFKKEDNGWCVITASRFEERTSLKKKSFLAAQKVLLDGGYIEKEVRVEPGTVKKATYFRPSVIGAKFQSELSEVSFSHLAKCEKETLLTEAAGRDIKKTLFNDNAKFASQLCSSESEGSNIPEEGGDFSSLSDAERSEANTSEGSNIPEEGGDFSSLSEAERSEANTVSDTRPEVIGGGLTSDPFDAPVDKPAVFDVRTGKQSKKNNPAESHARSLAREIAQFAKTKGYAVSPGDYALMQTIRGAISNEYTDEQIMQAVGNYFSAPQHYRKKFGLPGALSKNMIVRTLNKDFGEDNEQHLDLYEFKG